MVEYKKKVCSYKKWSIWSDKDGENFGAFLPGESPRQYDSADWEATNVQECKEFIDSY